MKALKRYLALHAQNFSDCLSRIGGHPFATALTVLVIAIALALPAGLGVLVKNAETLSSSWDSAADFTVFLHLEDSKEDALAFAAEIESRNDVQAVTFKDRDAAREEMRAYSGFGGAFDALDENPLPHALIVTPAPEAMGDLSPLVDALEADERTDSVQLDTEWVARLHGILIVGERFVDIVSVLLGLAVVIVVGNTIRLEIQNRRVEIEVMKLVGGSDGFIRRPFLYLGLLYGGIGALGAAGIIAGTLALLDGPVQALADLYDSGFSLTWLAPGELAVLLASGALLGWLGAGVATARHLRAIEPS